MGISPGPVISVTQKLALQAPVVIGSAMGLVGLVSVYCDWVKEKLLSLRQHVTLSEQTCPGDTLACCWDVKQPTNQPTDVSLGHTSMLLGR